MARGDITVFDEARATMLSGDWASTDNFYCAICDNTTTPAAATATPVIGDFTQVGDAGSYVNNGTSLGALSTLVSEAAGTMTFDSAINPTWAVDASNDTDAFWGIIYNFTDAGKDALAFVDLGGPVAVSYTHLTLPTILRV
jgi:hypothetical protein